MSSIVEKIPTTDTISYRIRFMRELPQGATTLKKFLFPEVFFAVVQTVSLEDILKNGVGENSADEICFLFISSGFKAEWHQQTEEWFNKSMKDSACAPIELNVKNNKILWQPGKTIIYGSSYSEETLLSLVEFSFYESHLRDLERQMDTDLEICHKDVHLTHSVGPLDSKQQAHVNNMTKRSMLARIKFVRLEPCLGKSSPNLPGLERRMLEEISEKTAISDRLETVDDKLEVLEDVYELANDRLTEFRYFSEEARLERWVIFLLWLEVALLLLELFMFWIKK